MTDPFASPQSRQRFRTGSPSPEGHRAFALPFSGLRILVTGAGGYIGSALVKAIAVAQPSALILLDSSEHSLFAIERHIAALHPDTRCHALLGSVADAPFLSRIFNDLHPQVVFHAAAFKHVALLESNPFAALANNALGTFHLAQAARQSGAKLTLISTDKAVYPRSVMGVSKRIAELFTVAGSLADCPMNAVRLGNVIGSTGSVIPIFLDQIQRLGPVTVTHPEASRYFLSIGETVEAVLAAGAAECEGCILLPEMAGPVRIADLARFLIENKPNVPIEFTGLRPGEKLSEDLFYQAETRVGSAPSLLSVIETARLSPTAAQSIAAQLSSCIDDASLPALIELLTSVVPEYVPSAALQSIALTTQVHS